MSDTRVPQTTSTRVFFGLFCIAEPALNVGTGLFGLVAPVAFAQTLFPSPVDAQSVGTSAEMIGMARLAALMIFVLGPLQRVALLHGSRSLRQLFLAGLLLGDLLHLGATLAYEATAGGWSGTGVAAMALATALAASRVFYLASGRVPSQPRDDASAGAG